MLSRLFLFLHVSHDWPAESLICTEIPLIIAGYIVCSVSCVQLREKFITIVSFKHHYFVGRSDSRNRKQRLYLYDRYRRETL